ncbi:MAG: hypothetical protein ACRC1K_07010 [Planctomycetia bacterium]
MTPFLTVLLAGAVAAAPDASYTVEYPASAVKGELPYGVTYTVWIPGGADELRGVIVHQHGCGSGACQGGATAASDLHWQALARKWNCALLGPSYHQNDGQDCAQWCDPRNGSEATFLRCLADFAKRSSHPELTTVPWCLWGHSGGGFWATLIQTKHPERIVAVWCRSGSAFSSWEKGEVPKPELSAAVYTVPVMLNPGAKEKGDPRFDGAWTGSLAMFQAFRAKNAPIGFAPDPRTSHECGDSRYLAIPYFDALLAQRLPAVGAADQKLKPVDLGAGWLATPLTNVATPAVLYSGKAADAVWLPNEAVAKAWSQYVVEGGVADATPPPAPRDVKAAVDADGVVTLTWQCDADLESGLAGFTVERDGAAAVKIPEKPIGHFGRPLFQTMSYHDTPEKNLPTMTYVDRTAPKTEGKKLEYRVRAVNSVGGVSEPTTATVDR